jgi:hypothetical protein
MSPLNAWHSCFAFKVYALLQTVRSRSISSMHFWSFPAYMQQCFHHDICTLFIKFTSFHHTKFHIQIGCIIIHVINFSDLFFNCNACLLKKKKTPEIVFAYCCVVHINHDFLACDQNHKYSRHMWNICIHTSHVSNRNHSKMLWRSGSLTLQVW